MTPVSQPVPTPPVSAKPTSGPPPSSSHGTHWLRAATHTGTSAGLLVLALALLGWSLFVRMPRLATPLVVQARGLPGTGSPGSENDAPLTADALAALQQHAAEARQYLVPRREDILPLLRAMERMADAQGWRLEATLQPAQAAPPGLEMLQRHPAAVTLQDQPLSAAAAPAYCRLMTVLRQFSLLDEKVDLVRLELKGNDGGVTTAALEFHFWTPNPNAQVAAK